MTISELTERDYEAIRLYLSISRKNNQLNFKGWESEEIIFFRNL